MSDSDKIFESDEYVNQFKSFKFSMNKAEKEYGQSNEYFNAESDYHATSTSSKGKDLKINLQVWSQIDSKYQGNFISRSLISNITQVSLIF